MSGSNALYLHEEIARVPRSVVAKSMWFRCPTKNRSVLTCRGSWRRIGRWTQRGKRTVTVMASAMTPREFQAGRGTLRILALDGGGILGAFTAGVLDGLLERAQ
jgi:hypothetical protein